MAGRHSGKTGADEVLIHGHLSAWAVHLEQSTQRKYEGGASMLESLSTEQLEFIKAIENYKNEKKKLFLSWSEVLDILKNLGYQKVAARRSASNEASSSPEKPVTARPDRLARSIEACKTGMIARTSN